MFKKLERFRLTPQRRRAVRRAGAWVRERTEDRDGLGAIFPQISYDAVSWLPKGIFIASSSLVSTATTMRKE